MKGVYTVKRKHGTAIYVNYTPPGERRIKEPTSLLRASPRTAAGDRRDALSHLETLTHEVERCL